MTPTDESRRSAVFTSSFGQLVILLRRERENTTAQKQTLRNAIAALAAGPVVIEAGIEHSGVPDEGTLKGILLVRHVDSIHFLPHASPAEILALARALAADTGAIPSTPNVQVERIPDTGAREDPAPAEPVGAPPSTHRSRTMAGPVEESERLTAALERAVPQGYWMEALHAAQALVRLIPRFPEHERRGYLIALRRVLNREVLDGFVQFALRVVEEQARVSEVLQHAGPEAIELMIDHVRGSESAGPWRFIHDLLARTPEALPMILPLLDSPRWHEVRHGAELLGRLGMTEAIGPLRKAAAHPDERVRKAAVEALACFHHNIVLEPIRRALMDPAPATRVSAAHALARRNSAGLALPILVALESEKNPETWAALAAALASIDSSEAIGALVTIALDHRPLFRTGRPMSQRLAAVAALAQAGHAGARRGLERLASEGDGAVRRAAAQALTAASGGG